MSTSLVAGHPGDTIFALASGSGRGAISVLRLSGDASSRLVIALAGGLPPARRASLRTLRSANGTVLDKAVVLWLPGPQSYTGEDSAEFHLHGGTAVRQAVMDELLHAGARPADAGEFTRRAVLVGRMDVLEAEAIGELVAAETEAQRSLAMAALLGGAGAEISDWSHRLTRALALEEASIDFPDDAGGEMSAQGQVDDIQLLLSEIDRHLAHADFGERRRHGVVIAITGAPNVGKSTLFNALVGRDAAIVSAQPGTTRDVLEAALDLSGLAATLIDTAGLRDTLDPVEAEGVRRARARAAAADIVLLVLCGESIEKAAHDDRVLAVSSKSDLHPPSPGDLAVSAVTGAGLSELRRLLCQRATALTQTDTDPVLSNARHVAALRDTRMSLHAALAETLPELRAENLRLALQGLGRLSGRVDTEAVLDVVFATFCIGK